MKKYYILAIIFIGCQSQKKLKLKTYNKEYSISILKGSNIEKKKDDNGFSELKANYPDGKIVYITDDYKNGNISQEKENKYGKDIYLKILTNDTLTLNGVSSNNLYWKEIKKEKIVVGYKNIPLSQKKEFDNIIHDIKIK